MPRSVRVLAGILVTTGVAACTTVASIQSPGKYIAGNKPRSVWLTKANKSVVRVDGPRMVGDTVVGAVSGEYTEIPLSEVTRASAIQADKAKTVLAGIDDTMTLQRQF